MSKAFVREDDVTEDLLPLPAYPVVPPGTPNYLTTEGARRLQEELTQLQEKRSTLSTPASDSEKRRLVQGIDHRLRHLQASLRTAEIVAGPTASTDVVQFGAKVTVRDTRGVEASYRIVGVDETDFERGEVSWLSPIARALMNRRTGDTVRFKAPRGWEDLQIIRLSYQ